MTTHPPIRRPIMRYPGGKWILARRIIPHFPEHRVYVEPYAGAASVLLQKPRAYAEIVNDLDGEIVNVFRVLQNREAAAELERMVRVTPFSRAEFLLAYERNDDTVERARRALIRSFMGHGSDSVHRRSGYRSKSFRSGLPPAGDWRNYPNHIARFCERIQGVNVENRPALDLIRHVDGAGVLFYVDPPYVLSTRQGGLYTYEMTDADHSELLASLLRVKGMVVISGYDHEIYRDTLQGWRAVRMDTYADGARKREEILWFSPNISPRREGLFSWNASERS